MPRETVKHWFRKWSFSIKSNLKSNDYGIDREFQMVFGQISWSRRVYQFDVATYILEPAVEFHN